MFTYRGSGIKFFILLLLLAMILARMIWIQLRFFPVNVDYRSLVTFGALLDSERDQACFAQQANRDQLWSLLTDNELVSDQRYRWFRVPGLEIISRLVCHYDAFTPQTMQWLNYMFFGGTVFLALLMVRFLSGSWILGLVAAAMLLSRGQLVAKIGELTAVNMVIFFFTLTYVSLVHHLRTASWWSFAVVLAGLLSLAIFDLSWVMLLLAFPATLLVWWLLRRLLSLPTLRLLRAGQRRWPLAVGPGKRPGGLPSVSSSQPSALLRLANAARSTVGLGTPRDKVPFYVAHAYARGGLLRPLEVPYSFWILSRRRWLKLVAAGLVFGFLVLSLIGLTGLRAISEVLPLDSPTWGAAFAQVSAYIQTSWVRNWFDALRTPADLHFVASLVVLLPGMLQNPTRGLHDFFEAAWLLIVSLLFLLVGAFVLDLVDARVLVEIEGEARGWSIYGWSRAPHIVAWVEPVVLSLGLAGLYNLLKIADAQFVQTPKHR